MGKQCTLYSAEAYSDPCQESKMKLFQSLTIFSKRCFRCLKTFVSTFTNVVKHDVENNNVVSTLSNVVHVNVEIYNVDSTLSIITLKYTTLFQR